ncbi:clostripain-related cysteine peptidase, partial [Capnocytophaga sp. HP1101]
MRYYSWLLICFGLLSCQKDSPAPEPLPSHEITLVYMVADNDLAPYALKDLNEIERGFVPNGRDKLLVYIDSNTSTVLPSHPVLLEIAHDTTEVIASKIISSYPEQNSADKRVMSNVLRDALNYYKGNNHYKGLVLWSHGNAWLPNGYSIETENKS